MCKKYTKDKLKDIDFSLKFNETSALDKLKKQNEELSSIIRILTKKLELFMESSVKKGGCPDCGHKGSHYCAGKKHEIGGATWVSTKEEI